MTHFKRTLGAAATLGIATLLGCQAQPASRIEPGARSLLLLTLDTTRADRLGAYGGRVPTPALSALAARGVRFDRAYATAPITLPAHASILTGLYPPATGVHDNAVQFAGDSLSTLAELLGAAGWETAAFVSAAVLDHRFGLDQGFTTYDDDFIALAERPSARTIDAALTWLDQQPADRRFFVWVHLFDPHMPYEAPEPFRSRHAAQPYDGEIAALDDAVGRLLAHPRLGASAGTAIVAIGDHGESLGEHGEQTHAMLAYDSTLHIPLIVAVPGGPAGTTVTETVSQVDVAPTVLAILGLPVDPALHGLDLLARINGAVVPALAERGIYGESWAAYYAYGWARQRTLRQSGYKLYQAPTSALYALTSDPGETTDRASSEPAIAARLAAALESDFGALDTDPAPAPGGALPHPPDELVARVSSLGYIGAGVVGRRTNRPDPRAVIGLHEAIQAAEDDLAAHRYEQALRRLVAVRANDPDNLMVLRDLALALAQLGRAGEARSAAERALELAPDSAAAMLALAALDADLGAADRALALAEQAVATDPNSLLAWIDRARYLAATRHRGDLPALFAAASERFGAKPRLEILRAELIDLPAGDLATATTRLTSALDREPTAIDGWRLLGDCLARRGDRAGAIAAVERGLEQRPDDPALLTRLGSLQAEAGDSAAEANLRRALAVAQLPATDIKIALADLLARADRREEAAAVLRELAETPGEDSASVHARAAAQLRLGEPAAAARLLRAQIDRHPGDANAHASLASLAVAAGDWRTAADEAEAAVAIEPGAAAAWNSLGIAREQQGATAAAIAAYQRALTAAPAYWRAGFNLGALYLRQGRDREAADALLLVVAQAPDHARAHLLLGRLFAGPLADPAAARDHFTRAAALAPDSAEGREARQRLEANGG